MSIGTLRSKNRTIEILLVEDNYGDALLTKKAFEKATTPVRITVAEDGEQAMVMLTQTDGSEGKAMPDLILLDINLPKLNGKEVLAKIKQHERLKHIPVIMFTSSSAEMDVLRSYELGVNGYIVKPSDLSKFADIVKSIEAFWFQQVILPDSQDITNNTTI